MDSCDPLLLQNQLCFPLYAASKALLARYEPLLAPLDLTYTQYIVMMALWEKREATVNEIGEMVCLDSGTLSPLINKLVGKGLVVKVPGEDKRFHYIRLTEEGLALKEKAKDIPGKIGSCLNLTPEEAVMLYRLCYKSLGGKSHG